MRQDCPPSFGMLHYADDYSNDRDHAGGYMVENRLPQTREEQAAMYGHKLEGGGYLLMSACDEEKLLRSVPLKQIPSYLVSRQPIDWGITFYIRVDNQGRFHTYPDVGGPFWTLQQADDCIESYLQERLDDKMFKGLSPVDLAVQRCLFWPDGTRKNRCRSGKNGYDEIRDWERQLVQALTDKHNQDYPSLPMKLIDKKDCQSIFEGNTWYLHINFTAESYRQEYLFFAEVMYGQSGELSVSYLSGIKTIDNGTCHGCYDNGSPNIRHPSGGGYRGGHVWDASLPFGGPMIPRSFFDRPDCIEDEEASLRRGFEGLADPRAMGPISTPNFQAGTRVPTV